MKDEFSTGTSIFLTGVDSDPSRMNNSTLYWMIIPFLPTLGGINHFRRVLLDLLSTIVKSSGAADGAEDSKMIHKYVKLSNMVTIFICMYITDLQIVLRYLYVDLAYHTRLYIIILIV